MGELLTQLVYLYAGAIVLDAWFKTIEADDPKSFRTMALRNGSNLCAFDPPSLLLNADQLGLNNASTSASLAYICAWHCARQPSCVSFSVDSCQNDCLLYFYAPQRCFYKIGCSHFESTVIQSCTEVIECPNNWIQKDNVCYYASRGVAVNETTAESNCEMMNASLVTISSQELNSFITNISSAVSSQDHWIGLHKKNCTPSGETYWLDGSLAAYRNWSPDGEPNEYVCCARLLPSGEWRDRSCSDAFEYICQMKLQP